MNIKRLFYLATGLSATIVIVGLVLITTAASAPGNTTAYAAAVPLSSDDALPHTAMTDDPNPPASPVKLIFIHHSTGGNWLADPAGNELGGDLGRELMNNNYFVSATNYGWEVGGDTIGDRTDVS